MFKFKRSLRVAVPVLFLMLGAAVSATIPVQAGQQLQLNLNGAVLKRRACDWAASNRRIP